MQSKEIQGHPSRNAGKFSVKDVFAGGYGHSSHPAMMGTGGTLSHLDQDVIPSDIYSQVPDFKILAYVQ